MSFAFEKAMVSLAMVSVSGVAMGYGCPPVIDSIWGAGVLTAGSTISAAVTGLTESVASARYVNLEYILSAMRVLTKQVDITASKQNAVMIAAKQGGATYLAERSARKAIFNTTMEYNAATGQGFDPCGELRRSKDVAVSLGEANRDMSEKVIRELDASPGRLVMNVGAVVAGRLSAARENYCTKDEQGMGFCAQAGSLAGADVDGGNFFSSATQGGGKAAAKSAMLNHLFGLPYQALSKTAAKTPAGQSFLDAKRSEDAYRSVAQNSLKTIQAWTESRSNGSTQTESVMDALSKKVGTYSGGDNYGAWEKSKISQSEHGLLVEYAKMAAAELYMMNLEYQQSERVEANVAAWLALRSRALSVDDTQVQRVGAVGRVK